LIVAALTAFGPRALRPVGRALERAAKRDRDPFVRMLAQAQLRALVVGLVQQGTAGAPAAPRG
jgi:hypothetical protein